MKINSTLLACLTTLLLTACASHRPTLQVENLAVANYDISKNRPITNSESVRSGDGTAIKGLDNWEGEITGIPTAGSKFSRLQIGLREDDVITYLGKPSDRTFRLSGKAFIPFYYGSGKSEVESIYNGQGRLIYSRGSGNDPYMYLTWIIHNPNENYAGK